MGAVAILHRAVSVGDRPLFTRRTAASRVPDHVESPKHGGSGESEGLMRFYPHEFSSAYGPSSRTGGVTIYVQMKPFISVEEIWGYITMYLNY